MKWLTREWASGNLKQSESQRRQQDRDLALHQVGLKWAGTPLGDFASCVDPRLDLSDAKIDQLTQDDGNRAIELVVVQGNEQTGYGSLYINLEDAEVEVACDEELSVLISRRELEVWYW